MLSIADAAPKPGKVASNGEVPCWANSSNDEHPAKQPAASWIALSSGAQQTLRASGGKDSSSWSEREITVCPNPRSESLGCCCATCCAMVSQALRNAKSLSVSVASGQHQICERRTVPKPCRVIVPLVSVTWQVASVIVSMVPFPITNGGESSWCWKTNLASKIRSSPLSGAGKVIPQM